MAGPKSERCREAGGEPIAKRVRSTWSAKMDTIEVLVGPNEAPFTISKIKATSTSPFLAAACSDHWIEGQQKIIRLPDHKMRVFEVYFLWLHTGKLDMSKLHDADSPHSPRYYQLVEVWAMADYLGCQELCNLVIDHTLEHIRNIEDQYPSPVLFHWLPPGCTMWKLMVDHLVSKIPKGDAEKVLLELPAEVIQEVARKFLSNERRWESDPLRKARCYYHEHGRGGKCPEESSKRPEHGSKRPEESSRRPEEGSRRQPMYTYKPKLDYFEAASADSSESSS